MTDGARAFPRLPIAALLVVSAILGLASLGTRDLWSPDEPRYALVAKEMIETGGFFLPHVNGEPYPDKPPLLFWTIALASLVTGGVGQPAAVLPSVIAALLALWGTARLAWRLSSGDATATILATGLLLVSYRFFQNSIVGQIDMLLTATEVWAVLWLVEGSGLSPDSEVSRGKVVLAFLVMGLGTLAKGPVAIFMPAGGVLLGAALSGARPPWWILGRARAWLAFAAPLLFWLVPAVSIALLGSQSTWIHDLLVKHTVVRYASSWHHNEPFWYFLKVVWYDFFPSALLLPFAIAALFDRTRSEDQRRVMRLLAGACLFALVFFSIPSGKRGLYLLPTYPLLATWVGIDLAHRLRVGGAALRGPRAACALLALIGVAGAPVLALRGPAELARRGVGAPITPAVVALAVIGLGAAIAALARRPRLVHYAGAGSGIVALYLVYVTFAVPVIDDSRSARVFIESVRARSVAEAEPAMVDFRAQFGFYAGRMLTARTTDDAALRRIAERLAGPAPFWVVMKAQHRALIDERLPPGASPVLLFERNLGDDDYIVLASPSASRAASDRVETPPPSPPSS